MPEALQERQIRIETPQVDGSCLVILVQMP